MTESRTPRAPHRASFTLTLLFGALLAGPALCDRLVTPDGRIIKVKKAREQDDAYRLVFEHAEIVVPREFVASVEIEGDMSEYVPQNDDEKDKLAKGFVKYHGKWMSKPSYANLLKKEGEERKARTNELALHSNFSNPYNKTTKHFDIYTNTSPELLDYYADLLEAYYKLMDKRIGIDPTPSMKRMKMRVNIYKSHEDFKAYNDGISGSVLGYFMPSTENPNLNFFHDYQEPERSDWVALHECTHLLTFLIDQDYLPQIWLNEAVADFFGSSTIERDKKGKLTITPGRLQTDRVLTVQQAIKDGNDIKLEDLFLIKRDDFKGFQYAHAWSFVYFLHSDKKYTKNFIKFFKELYTVKAKGIDYEILNAGYSDKTGTRKRAKPEQIRDVMLKRLKVKDVSALEEDWKDFVAAIEIDAPAARFKRGYNAVRSRRALIDEGDRDEATADIDAAIEAGITDPRAWSAKGWLTIFGMDIKGAVPHFEAAIERDPLNATYRYDLAFALSGFGSKLFGGDDEDQPMFGSEEELDEALVQFSLCTELAPENDRYRDVFTRFLRAREEAK